MDSWHTKDQQLYRESLKGTTLSPRTVKRLSVLRQDTPITLFAHVSAEARHGFFKYVTFLHERQIIAKSILSSKKHALFQQDLLSFVYTEPAETCHFTIRRYYAQKLRRRKT